MIALYITLLVICVLLSAFFASSETAFVSLQRAKLQHEVNTKVKGAARVLKLIQKPEKLLSTVLLGNNLVQNAAVALATALAIHLVGSEKNGIVVATIGITIILLIFGDTTPKTIATHHAEKLTRAYARPIEWLAWLLTPFVWVLSWIASVFTRMVGGKTVPHSLASEDEIRAMITVGESEGAVEQSEAEMLHKVFDFTDRPVREVMIPRTDVVFIESGLTVDTFLKVYTETPRSRYPVFRENRDHVIGIISVKDILMALAKGEAYHMNLIDDYLRPAYIAPEFKPIGKLFREMRDKNYHLCVVIDEFGGTAGVVTINQLIEEIVGPVGDELLPQTSDFQIIDAHTYEVDGNMRIEDVNTEMKLGLPEGDYETVAGFIYSRLGRVPKENEQIKYKNLKIVIKRMANVKIERILITQEDSAKTTN